jgi:hypothetical protein
MSADHELKQRYAGKTIFESDKENALGLEATLGKDGEGAVYLWTHDYHETRLSKEEALRLAKIILDYFDGP